MLKKPYLGLFQVWFQNCFVILRIGRYVDKLSQMAGYSKFDFTDRQTCFDIAVCCDSFHTRCCCFISFYSCYMYVTTHIVSLPVY